MRTKIRRRQTRSGPRWYVAVIDDDGHEHAHGGYRLEREAKAKIASILADSRLKGRYTPPSDLTVANYLLSEWLPSRDNADISATTRDTDATVVEAWILPHIGDVPLQRLSPKHLDALYRTLRERGGRGGRPLRGKSVRNAHVTLSKALGDALRRGHVLVNPILAVDPPARDDSVERTAWTRTEVRRFLNATESDRLAGVWRLALATGLRRAELLGLDWDAIDLEGLTVVVARQVLVRPRAVRGEPRVFIRETTKTRRRRRVRIDAATGVALKRWKITQAEERLAFGGAWKLDGGLGLEVPWVVTEPDGYVVNPETLLGRWKRLVAAAGVTPIGLHGARHSYAELALAAGVRLDVVSRQLGHASISTTANTHTHDSDEAAAAAAELVSRAMDGR